MGEGRVRVNGKERACVSVYDLCVNVCFRCVCVRCVWCLCNVWVSDVCVRCVCFRCVWCVCFRCVCVMCVCGVCVSCVCEMYVLVCMMCVRERRNNSCCRILIFHCINFSEEVNLNLNHKRGKMIFPFSKKIKTIFESKKNLTGF